MHLKKRHLCQLVILMTLLSSCSAIPTKKFVRTGPTYQERIPQIRTIGIINDVCIARDEIGSEYFLIEESKATESLMLESAATYLGEKGYQIKFQLSPLVCAFKAADKKFKVAKQQGMAVSDEYPPFFTSKILRNDEPYKQAVDAVTSQILEVVAQKKESPASIFLSDESVQKNLDIISKRVNTDTILFLLGDGTVISTGEKIVGVFGGVAVGIVTGIATAGLVIYVPGGLVSYLDTYAALVDMKTGEMLWSNAIRLTGGDPTEKEFYLKKWPKNIFYHLPEKEDDLVSALGRSR